MKKCDLCGAPEPPFLLPVEPYSIPEVDFTSDGAFAVCETCMTLAHKKDRRGLFFHVSQTIMKRWGLDKMDPEVPAVMEYKVKLSMVLDGFFEHWNGFIIGGITPDSHV